MYQVRWEYQGRVHYANTEAVDTAKTLMEAIAAFYSGDGIKVEIWAGSDVHLSTVS